MNYLELFGILSFASFAAMVLTIVLGIKKIKSLDKITVEKILAENSGFFEREIGAKLRIVSDNFKKILGHPEFLKFLEFFLRRLRILVLKIENFLLERIDYLRGKRKINSMNGEHSSEFMKEMSDWKNNNDKDKR
ncbi:MAG: hypothetical protein A3H02_00915 [Candidatus Niyogibacteria bacterium RIFCSPLOWO2_12_FULL_41_13]|uniref:Uncharacterized protein n=1 Tax=Candidatus Niyogibacteria bacterium RIFCSPLOWO2_12_FULL_41_13 TaxID=1801726 RepID=A0A1G2F3S9_9BACT|nr:MAG: hypothetical protein A3H02_00915 [Candidatus Niyogibacteria bacterium RIFCSPLOWO2_12_FULL_41_13]